MLIKALIIAAKAHKGQTDKAGRAYIYHPIHVAFHTKGIKAKTVALLHDVIEDTDITTEYLTRKGFDYEIISAVEAITKIKGESYSDYLQRVKTNDMARIVKIADLRHNSDLKRLKAITEKDKARIKKYDVALSFLTNNIM